MVGHLVEVVRLRALMTQKISKIQSRSQLRADQTCGS